MTRPLPWYRESFGADYLEVYAHRDDRQGLEQARDATRLLGLVPGARVLDVACGAGRHTFALRELGLDVTGMDLSIPLLRAARHRARESGDEDIGFVRGDMRQLPFRDAFDAALSLFTSFGYFEDDEENARVLRAIHSVLRPGGLYLLDFLNPELVVGTLEPRSAELREGRRIVQERSITADGARVEKTIRITPADPADPADPGPVPERVFRESVRLYSRQDIESMMARASLEVIGVHGSFAGEAWEPASPRMIFSARRPEESGS